MKKKENIFLIVNTLIITVAALVLIFGVTPAVPDEPKDRLFGKTVELRDEETIEEIPSDSGFAILNESYQAYTLSGDEVGTVYRVIARNSYRYDEDDDYGVIELLVGIQDERVFVEVVEIRQTSTYLAGIQNYVYSFYDGVDYQEVEDIEVVNLEDPEAGATASDSTATVKDLVWLAVAHHFDLETEEPFDLYEELFGDDFGDSEPDEDFEPTGYVRSKETVYDQDEEVIGHLYELEGEGEYDNGFEETEGSITIYVLLDEETNEILDIIAPEDDYGHTLSYAEGDDGVFDYVESFEGEELYAPGEDDLTAGATWSKQFVNELITDLSEVVTND
ncbi:MAG: hypothetical protein ACLFTZ_02505 [Acholeplasmataceae bacterium]